ncbi:MAG: DUF6134 family protein [Pseudomonadota bacterium]
MIHSLSACVGGNMFRGAAAVAALFFGFSASAFADKIDGVVAQSRAGDIVFAMDRKGSEIGHHSISYTPLDDGRLQVDVAITIKVKFAFITAYRYEHRNREIWSADGQTLLSIETQTHNNGKDIAVSGRRDGDLFVMTDEDGQTYTIEGPIAPTSYWTPLLLDEGVSILNTQKGKVTDVRFSPGQDSSVALPSGDAAQTTIYESEGELSGIFAEYSPENRCFVGLEFLPPKQDVMISYRLESYFTQKRSDLNAFPRLDACQSAFDAQTDGETYQLSAGEGDQQSKS